MKINSLKISLIIPAYNEEKYIGTCLDSVLKNRHKMIFFEIIVVDNASTDATASIAMQYKEVRVVQENQKGITRARQRGFEEATGDILAYIDADTRMPPSWPKILVETFNTNPQGVLVSGPYRFYDSSFFENIFTKLYWYIFGIPAYLLLGYMAIGGNFAIKRETLVAMGGFDTSIEFYSEDTNIARRAKQYGKVVFMLKFFMNTSARRLHRQGWIKTGGIYIKSFISEVIYHRPSIQKYKDFR